MSRSRASFGLLLLAVITLTSTTCIGKSAAENDPTRCYLSFIKPQNYISSCSFEVPHGAGEAQIHLQVHVAFGSLVWTLKDPRDVVRWGRRVDAGQTMDEVRVFDDPVDGLWLLEFDPENAIGEYDADWTACCEELSLTTNP